MVPLPRKSFAMSSDGRTLVAMASDFSTLRIQRIFDDACDEGIAIEATDGTLKRFYLRDIERQEGDIVAFHFHPVDPMIYRVTIFND
jgi:hypothetical protein